MSNILNASSKPRADWVDIAKGFVVIWVALYHASQRVTLGFPDAPTLIAQFAEFGRPVRMPFLFLLSGLFVAKYLEKPLKDFLDKKVLHLIYFFVLWDMILMAMKFINQKIPVSQWAYEYFISIFVQPPNALWFIAVLALFMLIIRLIHPLPLSVKLLGAALLQLSAVKANTIYIDNSAMYFIFFVLGVYFPKHIFMLGEKIKEQKLIWAMFFTVWIILNGFLVFKGYWNVPGLGLVLSLFGITMMIGFCVFLSLTPASKFFEFLGRNSLKIYLADAPFIFGSYMVFTKFVKIPSLELLTLVVWLSGIVGALILWFIVRKTPLNFLFERPSWARLK